MTELYEKAERHERWYQAKSESIRSERGAVNTMSDDAMRKELISYMRGSMTCYKWIRTANGKIHYPVIFYWGEVMVKSDHSETDVLRYLLIHQRDSFIERHCHAKESARTRQLNTGGAS